MEFAFSKMHGAGNDFILVDDREGVFPAKDKDFISKLCSRRVGVGSEGLILVQRSETSDFRMRFFNPDGTEAEMCGNGARCVAAFSWETGVVAEPAMRFDTVAGEVCAKIVSETTVKIAMPPVKDMHGDFVVAGVPHKIEVVENIGNIDVNNRGREIRYSREFAPGGTNVDFVSYEKPHLAYVRTYERGVEAESGACGTGSVASAVIGVKNYQMAFPVVVKTSGGYELVIDGDYKNGEFSNLTLTGPVEKVFSGTIRYETT